MAVLKALPTDEEIEQSGCSHAGTHLQWLRDSDGDAYDQLIAERATPWGEEPVAQAVSREVAHTLEIIVCNIEAETAGKDNLEVTPQEVTAWLKKKWLHYRTPVSDYSTT